MKCPKCGSQSVLIQESSSVKSVNAHHGLFWWLFIGWWWLIIKWVFLTIPALLAKIFIPKKQKIKQKFYSVCVCQNCGHRWEP